VRVVAAAAGEELEGDARLAAAALTGDAPVALVPGALDGAAGVVDCILGTGSSGAPRGAAAEAIRLLLAAGLPVVACDVPSGVDASTGAVADPGLVVHAAATVTFAAAKPGLWIHPGKDCAGRVEVLDIGVEVPRATAVTLAGPGVLAVLPEPGATATKFTAGHVLVVGGSRGLTGAVCLAAEAAARAGAGYVSALVPASLEAIFEVKLTEVMTRGLPDADGVLVAEAAQRALDEAGRHPGALVLGGGAGRSEATRDMIVELAEECPLGLVLDADGLNAFAGQARWLAPRAAATILTPHAGELGRLLGVTSATVEARRLEHARAAAAQAGAIVVLKGDDTLVAGPDGRVAVSPGRGAGPGDRGDRRRAGRRLRRAAGRGPRAVHRGGRGGAAAPARRATRGHRGRSRARGRGGRRRRAARPRGRAVACCRCRPSRRSWTRSPSRCDRTRRSRRSTASCRSTRSTACRSSTRAGAASASSPRPTSSSATRRATCTSRTTSSCSAG
jgi:NAD(P)H-hydrate epimerase